MELDISDLDDLAALLKLLKEHQVGSFKLNGLELELAVMAEPEVDTQLIGFDAASDADDDDDDTDDEPEAKKPVGFYASGNPYEHPALWKNTPGPVKF